MDIKKQILTALGLEENQVKLSWQSKSEDGGTIFVSTAEELESGVDVSVLLEDGTTVKLPIGTYKTDTGISFRVEEEGIVAEVIESETEEKVEAKKEADEAYEKANFDESKEEMAEDDESRAEETDWAKTYEELKDKVMNLEDAIADIKKQIGESGDVEEMAEVTTEPSTNPKTIKTTEVKEFSAEDEIKKLKEENKKLKTELSSRPADSPLNINKFSTQNDRSLSQKEMKKLSKRERFLYNLNK